MLDIHMLLVAAMMYLQKAEELELEFAVPWNEVLLFLRPLVLKVKNTSWHSFTEMLTTTLKENNHKNW